MKKVLAFISAFFSNPKNDIKKSVAQIDDLQRELEKINYMPNKVEAIVRLFQVISPIQDTGGFASLISKLQKKNYGQLDQVIEALETLQKHFTNAGRSIYGFNRTKEGEAVTAEKVYLGNVHGVWTKPASYWLEKQEEFKKDIREDLSRDPEKPITTWYCIHDYQAANFVKSHVDGILMQILVIRKAA